VGSLFSTKIQLGVPLIEYLGEILTKQEGDRRDSEYDKNKYKYPWFE